MNAGPSGPDRFRRHIVQLWLGQLLSALGDRLHEIALVWIAVQALGEQAAWVIAGGSLGRLVFGLPGGALADRWDRQRTMVACDLLRGVAVGTLALVDLSGPRALWLLGAVALVTGALDSLFQPALQASLPALAPDRQRLQVANAWLDVTRRLAVALGPSATGLLLAALPLQQFFAIDAASFAVSALAIRALGRAYRWKPAGQPSGAAARRGMLGEIAGAGRLVAAHAVLTRGLTQVALWNLLLSPAFQLGLALLIKDELGGGPALLGYVTGAYGVGNVLSNLALTRIEVRNTARTLYLGALVAALGWIAVANAPSVPLLLLLIALTAVGGPMNDLMLLRIIQTEFPTDQIGKVYSFRYTLSRSSNALGLALAAPLYATLGVRPAICAAGLILGGYALSSLLQIERSRPSQ